MSTFFNDKKTNEVLHKFIHQLFGRQARLQSHEYMVHFDINLDCNYEIKAGKCIHIFIRSLPNEEYWALTTAILRRIFVENVHPLKEFLYRDAALVLRKDAIKWYGLKVGGMDLDPVHTNEKDEFTRKRVDVNSFEQFMITSLHVKDKKSGMHVVVELVNGDVFSAQEKALKILYGDKIE